MSVEFKRCFRSLTGHEPFPWQCELYERFVADRPDNIPASCNLPTGLGKTSVAAIWLIALASRPERMPRRLVYVVNRRTVVDQTTNEVEKLRRNLFDAGVEQALRRLCATQNEIPLAISTLRGQFADNREWSADPSRPAVIVGTVDMIGSRLLFSGFGVGFKAKPLHGGFLGQDALLVHDEAHLEPAFQELLVAIEKEQQRCQEFQRFRVMELSATSRGNDKPFGLTTAEMNAPDVVPDPIRKPIHVVWRRQKAKKAIHFHENNDEKKVADEIVDIALTFKDSESGVLVFVRRLEDVEKIVKKLPRDATQQLTGTLRGLERDRMADPRKETGCPIFARFLKRPKADADDNEQWNVEPKKGTVYLVCTSAGEVGVNISADHLVCDLATFDSMAQRFGRVNRFGDRDDTEIHVIHPKEFADNDVDQRRKKSLDLLLELNGDGSPQALGELKPEDRLAAFAPAPTILPTSDILFDSWALTTIRGNLPGRPVVEPYLHGISDSEAPVSQVAWREEVGVITGDLLQTFKPEDLLDDYPLKPQELLRDRSDRVFKHLVTIAERHPNDPAWLVDGDGTVEAYQQLSEIANQDRRSRIYNRTILLPPKVGGLDRGRLNGESASADDVADEWYEDTERLIKRRVRVWGLDDDPEATRKTKGMRLVRPVIDTWTEVDDDEEATGKRFWRWYTRPRSADDDLSKTSTEPIRWKHHTDDVTRNTKKIVEALELAPKLQEALILAAKLHDLGKQREIWQRSIGNPKPDDWHAKSGKPWKPSNTCPDYRHEFGSLLDILKEHPIELQRLSPQMQDVVLHLVAAHHGYARPHFPPDNAYDLGHNTQAAAELADEIPRRFARLQRKYGRWGLAYLESLLRAADWAASAEPSPIVKGRV